MTLQAGTTQTGRGWWRILDAAPDVLVIRGRAATVEEAKNKAASRARSPTTAVKRRRARV